ncbi:TRAP transporter substrate-binding protein DctP [Shinella sp.]|uniref:TRAP transporter substrate-binding protein DctP n=1 Tax=Shinella sp. TaxID=1870904 RepID=UPI0039E56963
MVAIAQCRRFPKSDQDHRKKCQMTTSSRRGRILVQLGAMAAVGAFALTACSPGSADPTETAAEDFDEVQLSVTLGDSATTTIGSSMVAWQEAVTEATGGKVTFENFFSGSLVPSAEGLEAVGSGLADIAELPAVYVPQQLPTTVWLDSVTSALVSPQWPADFLEGQAGIAALDSSPQVVADAEAAGVHWLGTLWTPGFSLLCVPEVTDLASAAGKRVRAGGTVISQELEALGMVTVTVPIGEAYDALQRGVVDCIALSLPSLLELGFTDVAKNLVTLSMTGTARTVFMNKDKWDGLSEATQSALTEASLAFRKAYYSKQIDYTAELMAPGGEFEQAGVVTHEAPELSEVIEDQKAKRIASAVASAEGITDPEDLFKQLQAAVEDFREAAGEIPLGYDVTSSDVADQIADLANRTKFPN